MLADCFAARRQRDALPVRCMRLGKGHCGAHDALAISKKIAMEEHAPTALAELRPSDAFSRALEERRKEALQLVTAQQEQFQRIESELETHLAELERRVAAGLAEAADSASGEHKQLAEALRAQAEDLAKAQAQLAADRSEIASRQAELHLAREQLARQHQELAQKQREENEQHERRAAELREREAKTKQDERVVAAAQEELQGELRQLAARKSRIEETQLRVEKELEDLESRREETRSQRRRIAQQLKIERAGVVHEKELLRAEMDRQRGIYQKEVERAQAQLQEDRAAFEQETTRQRQQLRSEREQLDEDAATLAESRRQWDETQRQLAQTRDEQSADLLAARDEISRLTTALASAKREANQHAAGLAELQEEHETLKRSASKRESAASADANERIAGLEDERSSLSSRVQDLERQLTAANERAAKALAADNPRGVEDLQRRLEMATDEVRKLKRQNADLEEKLATKQAAAPRGTAPSSCEGQDWESTKRRLLAQLEGESQQEGGLGAEERLTVEKAIRSTTEALGQRDREITELKERLAQKPSQATAESQAVRSAAEADVLDGDALVQEERKRLSALQDEWQSKLRQAEVEISVQRARLARERAELDEKLRTIEAQKSAMTPSGSGSDAKSPDQSSGKPARRWLSRLGLKENENDK